MNLAARISVLVALPLAASVAQAQFKCTGADGRVTFQQTPCEDRQRQESVRTWGGSTPAAAKTSPAPAATPQRTDSPYTRLNDQLQRERRTKEAEQRTAELERDIQATQAAIDQRNRLMEAEMAALRDRKQYARNNLAGATWEQSISTEMQAVAAKYKALNDSDHERLKQLRVDLAAAKQAAGN